MGDIWAFIIQNLRLVRFRDYIDILIVAFIIYGGIKLVKETRATQLVKGYPGICACGTNFELARP